jgi:diguanylate cyclase (GGDEF)-like protein
MAPIAERAVASWDFALPSAEPPRALWARTQRALKGFLFGAPEDALFAAAFSEHKQSHLAMFALLTLPLALAWLPSGGVGRWTILFSLLSGLVVAARLESGRHARIHPLRVLAVGALYAISLSGVAWELLGPRALRLDPLHWLAGIVAISGFLSLRGDPRLCLLAGIVGVSSLAASLFVAPGASASESAVPLLIAAAAAGFASTLAAQRGRQLQRLAVLDTASGALHAGAFERCLLAAQRRASASAEPLMLARIEFSALPAIRARHGAALADALLRWLANALIDRFRATDLLGRTGDDEFSLALQGTDHPGVARRLERLRDELRTIELSRDGLRQPLSLRVTFGLAAFPREAEEVSATQRLAGERLALSKWRARATAA